MNNKIDLRRFDNTLLDYELHYTVDAQESTSYIVGYYYIDRKRFELNIYNNLCKGNLFFIIDRNIINTYNELFGHMRERLRTYEREYHPLGATYYKRIESMFHPYSDNSWFFNDALFFRCIRSSGWEIINHSMHRSNLFINMINKQDKRIANCSIPIDINTTYSDIIDFIHDNICHLRHQFH